MVTEQVKRLRATLRTVGFTTRDFSVRAERTTEGRRGGARGYTVFGRAAGVTKNRDAAERAFEARHKLAAAGLTVQVYEGRGDGRVSFITVHEPWAGEGAVIVRQASSGASYYEKKEATTNA